MWGWGGSSSTGGHPRAARTLNKVKKTQESEESPGRMKGKNEGKKEGILLPLLLQQELCSSASSAGRAVLGLTLSSPIIYFRCSLAHKDQKHVFGLLPRICVS